MTWMDLKSATRWIQNARNIQLINVHNSTAPVVDWAQDTKVVHMLYQANDSQENGHMSKPVF